MACGMPVPAANGAARRMHSTAPRMTTGRDQPAPGAGIVEIQASFEDKLKGAGERHTSGPCKNGGRKKGEKGESVTMILQTTHPVLHH